MRQWHLAGRLAGALTLVTAAALLGSPASNAGEEEKSPTAFSVVFLADAPRTAGKNTFWAQLHTLDSVPIPGAKVELWVKEHGDDGFHEAKQGVTGEDGEIELTVKVLRNVRTKWKYAGDDAHLPSVSPTQAELIMPRVGIRVSDKTPRVGQKVVFTGDTVPARTGQTVMVFRGHTARGGFGPPYPPSTQLARGVVRADGTYRLVVRFAKQGKKNVYVEVAGGQGNMTGWSADRKIYVG